MIDHKSINVARFYLSALRRFLRAQRLQMQMIFVSHLVLKNEIKSFLSISLSNYYITKISLNFYEQKDILKQEKIKL